MQIERMSLLLSLFEQVWIPHAVAQELLCYHALIPESLKVQHVRETQKDFLRLGLTTHVYIFQV